MSQCSTNVCSSSRQDRTMCPLYSLLFILVSTWIILNRYSASRWLCTNFCQPQVFKGRSAVGPIHFCMHYCNSLKALYQRSIYTNTLTYTYISCVFVFSNTNQFIPGWRLHFLFTIGYISIVRSRCVLCLIDWLINWLICSCTVTYRVQENQPSCFKLLTQLSAPAIETAKHIIRILFL